MAARLKRLEGMVRDMLDEEGNIKNLTTTTMTTPPNDDSVDGSSRGDAEGDAHIYAAPRGQEDASSVRPAGGQVIRANNGASGVGSTTYVGATHFMAILDDVCLS